MPKIVDHEQRKQDIVNVAMEMLSENESLVNINMVSIAKRCELSRPTLYQYFHDKHAIYKYAIKNITNNLFEKYSKLVKENEPIESIENIVNAVLEDAESFKFEILALLSLVIQSKREGETFLDSLNARTIKFNILLKRLLSHAKNNGTIKSDSDCENIASNIVYLIESACFNIAFFNGKKEGNPKDLLNKYIESLYI